MLRSVVLVAVAGCIPAGGATSGPSAPPPAPPGESYATVTTTEDPGSGTPVAPEDPYADAACPTDLSLTADREIDGRDPAETIPARYAKEHMKPVKPEHLVAAEDAIDRVIALEAETAGVVPAGFRAELADRARDPRYRLYMARCELTSDETTRRAGYDAALAYLLGASADEVWPLVEQSFYPDGPTVMTCMKSSDCGDGMKCDRVERVCRTKRARTAAFLSKPELAIEDVLARAFAGMLTPEMIANDRYQPRDLIGTWAYGRFIKCSGALCNFTRYQVSGSNRLVQWDRRYRGESYGGASEDVLTGDAKECFDHTEAASLDQCTYRCGQGAPSKEAACIVRCQAWCK